MLPLATFRKLNADFIPNQLVVSSLFKKEYFKDEDQFLIFFYHGDRVWTALGFKMNVKNALHLVKGPLVDVAMEVAQNLNEPIQWEQTTGLYGETITKNLGISSWYTFVMNDDNWLKQNLNNIVEFEGKFVKVLDMRDNPLKFMYPLVSGLDDDGDYIESIQNYSLKKKGINKSKAVVMEAVKKTVWMRNDNMNKLLQEDVLWY